MNRVRRSEVGRCSTLRIRTTPIRSTCIVSTTIATITLTLILLLACSSIFLDLSDPSIGRSLRGIAELLGQFVVGGLLVIPGFREITDHLQSVVSNGHVQRGLEMIVQRPDVHAEYDEKSDAVHVTHRTCMM